MEVQQTGHELAPIWDGSITDSGFAGSSAALAQVYAFQCISCGVLLEKATEQERHTVKLQDRQL